MAKKVTGYIKLQIPAGKATPAPPVGPALGQHGVNCSCIGCVRIIRCNHCSCGFNCPLWN